MHQSQAKQGAALGGTMASLSGRRLRSVRGKPGEFECASSYDQEICWDAQYSRLSGGAIMPPPNHVLPSKRIMGVDEVSGFDRHVAGKAGLVHCLVGGFAVVKLSEPPAAGRGVFS